MNSDQNKASCMIFGLQNQRALFLISPTSFVTFISSFLLYICLCHLSFPASSNTSTLLLSSWISQVGSSIIFCFHITYFCTFIFATFFLQLLHLLVFISAPSLFAFALLGVLVVTHTSLPFAASLALFVLLTAPPLLQLC